MSASEVEESAPAVPVTVEQVVRQAVDRPALAAALASAIAVEDAEVVAAGLWPNPEIDYEREQIIGGAQGASEDAVAVSQTFELSGRRGLLADAATHRGEAARLDGETTRRRTAAEARKRFWEVVYQQARHEVTTVWLERLQAAGLLILAREEAGESSAFDVLRIDREVRRAHTALGLAAADREGAWLALLVMTGPLPPSTAWPRVVGELMPPAAAEESAPDDSAPDAVEGEGRPERPDLEAWSRRSQAAQLEADAAGRGWIPALGLTAGWKTVEEAGARDHGFAAGLGLSIPLFDFGQGDEARARAAVLRADAMRALLAEDASRRERPARDRADRLAELARRVRTENEEGSPALEETAQAAWLAGEIELDELLDVHRGTRDDALALLALERSARSARESLRLITLEEVP